MTAKLLGYPRGSVGRNMSPEVVTLRDGLSVGSALQSVRTKGLDADNIYTLAVVDDTRKLVGPVALADLVMADPLEPLTDIVDEGAVVVSATDSAEAARLIQETNEPNLLVVDSERRLVGLISYDDAMEVL